MKRLLITVMSLLMLASKVWAQAGQPIGTCFQYQPGVGGGFCINTGGQSGWFPLSGDVTAAGNIPQCSPNGSSQCGQINVNGVHFGTKAIPFSTTAPTSGQSLVYDGTKIGGGGGGGAGACTATIPSAGTCTDQAGVCAICNLTSAQIKAFDLTAVTIKAAPGANKQILPSMVCLESDFGTTAYTTPLSGTTVELFYNAIATANIAAKYIETASSNTLFLAASGNKKTCASLPIGAGTFGGWSGGAASIFGSSFVPTVAVNQPVLIGMKQVAGQTVTYNTGPITTMTVAVAGSGYAVNDTFNIDPADLFDDTNDATGHVTSIGAGGSVTGVAINAAGFSYPITTANPKTGPYPTVHTSGAGNDALTVNVTGATTGDGTGVVEIWYTIAASP